MHSHFLIMTFFSVLVGPEPVLTGGAFGVTGASESVDVPAERKIPGLQIDFFRVVRDELLEIA